MYSGLNRYVINSCAPDCAPVSPRLWAIALFDPDDFDLQRSNNWAGPCGGVPCVKVANIVGFFIDYLADVPANNYRHGHYVRYPGFTTTSSPTLIENGSWLVEPHLVR
jgi:hypothetical protein